MDTYDYLRRREAQSSKVTNGKDNFAKITIRYKRVNLIKCVNVLYCVHVYIMVTIYLRSMWMWWIFKDSACFERIIISSHYTHFAMIGIYRFWFRSNESRKPIIIVAFLNIAMRKRIHLLHDLWYLKNFLLEDISTSNWILLSKC